MDNTPPQRKLPINPSLEHLQKQAKDRVKENPSLQLAAAQHQIAQEYGFKNWAELAQAVKELSSTPPKKPPILCEQCGSREATVRWSTIVAKKKTDQNLCAECAAAREFVLETESVPASAHGPVIVLGKMHRDVLGRMHRDLDLRLTDTDDIFRAALILTRKLLLEGQSTRLWVKFREHEKTRTDAGLELLKKALVQLEDIAQPLLGPQLVKENALLILKPKRPPPRKSTKAR